MTEHKPYYVMNVDTYDKDVSVYTLFERNNGSDKLVLSKKIRDKDEFQQEVINLAKYFNAEIWDYDGKFPQPPKNNLE